MSIMNYGLLLFATVFAGNLYAGEAGVQRQCYSCRYSTDLTINSIPNCNDGKDFSATDANGTKINTLTCDGKCSKSKLKAGSHVTIIRGCSTTCVNALIAGMGMACCETDFCNGAWRMSQTTPPVFALAAIVALLVAGLIRG